MNFVAPTGSTLIPDLRPEAREAPESGIVEVMNYGRLREGLIPLWVGEGDLPTPAFIREAAARSLAAGETFYTWQRGIPELREALARYHERLYGQPFSPERFYVTGSGMQSLQIAVRMIGAPATSSSFRRRPGRISSLRRASAARGRSASRWTTNRAASRSISASSRPRSRRGRAAC